jgi:hypothetical protein
MRSVTLRLLGLPSLLLWGIALFAAFPLCVAIRGVQDAWIGSRALLDAFAREWASGGEE